jgi:hypothetical protein
MQPELTYSLDHTTSSLYMAMVGDRLVVDTQGKGALDKPKSIDIPLSGLKQFCLVPTIAAQNLHNARTPGDFSYDSEFIFSYLDGDRTKTKRVFVNSQDPQFRSVLNALATERPDASLLELDPAEAQKRMGVLSAAKTVVVILALLIGVPIAIAIIYIISLAIR